jgi:Protein of unknown function, DUF547
MYTLKTAIILFVFVMLTACNNDTSSRTEKEQSGGQPEPISKQAAELQALSEQALNKSKQDIIDGNRVVNAGDFKATLSTEPLVAESGSEKTKVEAVRADKPTPIKKEKLLPVNNTTSTKEVKVTNPTPPATKTSKPAATNSSSTDSGASNKPVPPTSGTGAVTNTKPESNSGKEAPKHQSEEKKEMKVDHSAFDALLRKYVNSSGKVNYKGIKSEQAKLDAYLTQLSGNPVQDNWSRNEKMAYWINVYNAFTIKLILDNYPLKSITNLEGGKPWDKKWIKIGDKTYSLNQVENDILRPQFKEPAIHFAVNCAAKSCPPLLNQAWTADNLKTNFKKQASAFINNTSYNQISANKAKVSKIFDWYKVDFGNLIDYLNIYATTQLQKGAAIEYMEYDWSLNE